MLEPNKIFKFNKSSLILIEGNDKFDFIQGIISNDIKFLKKKKSIYAAMLSPQGRYLYDFFITNHNNNFLLECPSFQATEIYNKLNLYKLRSDVKIKIIETFDIFLVNKLNLDEFTIKNSEGLFFEDPRFNNNLVRVYAPKEFTIKNRKISLMNEDQYNDFRINMSIPDFTKDSKKEKSLLLEMRFDKLNGISWEKGCYLGQEITARMKYRGKVKKKIFSIFIDFKSRLDEKIFYNEKEVGMILSHNNVKGLAFIDIMIDIEPSDYLICGDSKVRYEEPWWSKK
ncbi:MAG: folate-binding protein YgfZ [Rickettsiales bacterium]|nr:folate-binding protein YgfZ [Rickettsiales bacterium]